jgi:hypothetical protein
MSHRNSHHGSPAFSRGSLVELCESSHGFFDGTIFRVDGIATVGGKFFVNVTSLKGQKCRFLAHELGLHECETCPHLAATGPTSPDNPFSGPF